jgi:hypothetical protein
MIAHAFLTIVAATEQTRETTSTGWISLTCNEVQHLFATLTITTIPTSTHRLRLSHWRRHHQYRARRPTTSDNPPENHDHHDLQLEY